MSHSHIGNWKVVPSGIMALPLLMLFLLFVGCNGVEKYRADIENVASDWDITNASLNTFSNALNGDLANFAKAVSTFNVSEDVLFALKPEQTKAYEAAKADFVEALQKFGPIRIQLQELKKTWGSQAASLQSLKDGLSTGNLSGDINGKIIALSGAIAEAREKLTSWESSHTTITVEAQKTVDAMKSAYEELVASGALPKDAVK